MQRGKEGCKEQRAQGVWCLLPSRSMPRPTTARSGEREERGARCHQSPRHGRLPTPCKEVCTHMQGLASCCDHCDPDPDPGWGTPSHWSAPTLLQQAASCARQSPTGVMSTCTWSSSSSLSIMLPAFSDTLRPQGGKGGERSLGAPFAHAQRHLRSLQRKAGALPATLLALRCAPPCQMARGRFAPTHRALVDTCSPSPCAAPLTRRRGSQGLGGPAACS